MSHIKYILFIAALMTSGIDAVLATSVPKIVVNITIDGLRSDYINAFIPIFGDKGFKKLLNEGKVYSNAEYPNANTNRSASIATIVTGTVPYDHGIINDRWLDRNTLRYSSFFDDNKYEGLLTAEKTSATNLLVSTISDELKVASEGKSIVFAISPFRDASVLGAGHAGNGAFWINELTGKWCGSSYYSSMLPSWVTLANNTYDLNELLNKPWEPVSDLSGNFSYFLSGGIKTPFKHKFTGNSKFKNFITSALVNEHVARLANMCISSTRIGEDDISDYLSITFYAGTYAGKPLKDCSMELQDTYVRLDDAIASIIENTEKKVGKENALFVITSTGTADTDNSDLSQYRIPTGNFYINRTASLLNMMLVALYGPGQYVEAYSGLQIYLNHQLLKDKQLSLSQVLSRCQELLLQSSGVKDVYTSERLLLGAWTPGISKIRNSYNPKCSGDILIQIASGWNLINEDTGEKQPIRECYIPFPIIYYGFDNKAQIIETQITTDYIAPTLSKAMRIRAPNGCSIGN